jgi:hypothetical protein
VGRAPLIQERRAKSLQTAGVDVVIAFEGDAPSVARASLLLDAAGHLVGVDLGGEGFARTVVMLGPHEAVAAQREAAVTVRPGELRIAAAGLPATPNPYVG